MLGSDSRFKLLLSLGSKATINIRIVIWDKRMDDELMYFSHDDIKITHFFRSKLKVEKFGH